MTVGYLGPSGSFTHNVAVKAFPEANRMPFANITEVIKSYEEGFVDYAIIPVENSIEVQCMKRWITFFIKLKLRRLQKSFNRLNNSF